MPSIVRRGALAPVVLAVLVAGSGAGPAAEASAAYVQPISHGLAYGAPCASPLAANNPEGEFGPEIAADPTDRSNLAAVWTQGFFTGAVAAVSSDGGRTWTQRPVPFSSCAGGKGLFAADPRIVYGADGSLYVIAITGQEASGLTGGPTSIAVSRSVDQGRTWRQPVAVVDDGRDNDRPAIGVDPARPGRLYAVWTATRSNGGFELVASRSDDHGGTWSAPRAIYGAEGIWPNGASIAVLENGSILVIFQAFGKETHELALRSTDGGETWTLTEIATTGGSWPRSSDVGDQVIAHAVPSLMVDDRGTAWVAWQDIPDPSRAAIWVARSTDGGISWGKPRVAADVPGQAWVPSIAAKRGSVAVSWYDTRLDRPGDASWDADVRIATSKDGGKRWKPQILAGPFDLRTAMPMGPGAYSVGNYQGLVPTAHGFGAVFSMGAPRAPEPTMDVFFAEVGDG